MGVESIYETNESFSSDIWEKELGSNPSKVQEYLALFVFYVTLASQRSNNKPRRVSQAKGLWKRLLTFCKYRVVSRQNDRRQMIVFTILRFKLELFHSYLHHDQKNSVEIIDSTHLASTSAECIIYPDQKYHNKYF